MKSDDIESQTQGMESERVAANGEVGYRRPPKSTRFRPGLSGNPRGRPKGSLNIQTVLMATLRTKVTINEGGKRRQVTKFEAGCMQQVNKFASGDSRAFALVIDFVLQMQSNQSVNEEVQLPLKVADQKIMARLLERFQAQNKVENTNEKENENV
jgi:Family of unknown function (DUF5681)